MKTFGKIIICIIVILLAIGTACLIHNNQTQETNNNKISNTNTTSKNQNTDNEKVDNSATSENNENKYIGEEEQQQEEIIENEETENTENKDNQNMQEELTGKDKAIDIVTKKYAMEGEVVKFDHMEGSSYVIKINAGTAVTWYIVDGTTWEASEY